MIVTFCKVLLIYIQVYRTILKFMHQLLGRKEVQIKLENLIIVLFLMIILLKELNLKDKK